MVRSLNAKLPLALVLAASSGVACGSDGHYPPPVGSGGRSYVPPIIVEVGGTSQTGGSTGAGTGATNGGAPDNFAGTTSFGPGGSFAGDNSFGGSTTAAASFGGSTMAGTAQGGSIPTQLGGSNGFSGSF